MHFKPFEVGLHLVIFFRESMKTYFLKTLIIISAAASWSYSQPAIAIKNDFNLHVDQNKLEKVLLLNDYSAIINIIQTDVDLYKIDFDSATNTTSQIQQLIRQLPHSPLDMNSILTALDIKKVIGLFLPYEQLLIKNSPARDALFIREDAGVWTLIHEYMHFLFNEGHRQKNMLPAPELKNAITDNTETYNEEVAHFRSNQKFQTEARQNNYTEALQNLCKLNLQYVLNFSIEEIVIEEQLQHKYNVDREKNIHFLESEENSYSNKYISKNLKSALNTTEYMLRLIEDSKKLLPEESYKKISAELKAYRLKYTDILFQLKKRIPPETKPVQKIQIETA